MPRVSRSPFAWFENKAWDFPTIWDAISRHHPIGHPVSRATVAVIFFEETGFCNVSQAQTSGSLGVGFGQLEVSNPEKKEFYASLPISTDYRQVAALMLGNNDTSVRIHCGYFQFLTNCKGLGAEGCLAAQVGPHRSYVHLFREGARLLDEAMAAGDRKAMIGALNYARSSSGKKNGIPERLFPDFWEFILPAASFKRPEAV